MFLRYDRLSQPTTEPITLADAKTHLRVDGTDEDDYIDALISVAREKIETYTRRFIAECDVAILLDSFPAASSPIDLAFPDVQSIAEITYIDDDGALQTIAATDVTLDADRREIRPDTDWPTDARMVRIECTIGLDFSASPDPAFPKPLRQAILLYITDLFENRGTMQAMQRYENRAAEALAHPYRINIGL